MYVSRERLVAWLCIITLASFTAFVAQKATAEVPPDFQKGYATAGKVYGPLLISVCTTEEEAHNVVKAKDQQKAFDDEKNCDNVELRFKVVKVLKTYKDMKLVLIQQPGGDATRVWFTSLEVKEGEWI